MAFITRLAVVLITRFVAVLGVHLGLIVFVTQNALEHFVIRRIHMAGGAALPLAAMLAGIDSKILAIMIERCRPPGIHRMASFAVVRKIQSHMIRIRWPLKIRLMARIAIQRRAGIAIIDVALVACRRHMRAEQRKARFAVIKSRGLPGVGSMARRTSVRKVGRHVIGVGRALEIALMARETIRRCAGKAIVDVTQIAGHGQMRAGQWKARAVVIEICRPPRIIVVAG